MMKSQLAKYQLTDPMTDAELLAYEKRLYAQTGKGLCHPDEFQEIHVRDTVKKHFDKKYGHKGR